MVTWNKRCQEPLRTVPGLSTVPQWSEHRSFPEITWMPTDVNGITEDSSASADLTITREIFFPFFLILLCYVHCSSHGSKPVGVQRSTENENPDLSSQDLPKSSVNECTWNFLTILQLNADGKGNWSSPDSWNLSFHTNFIFQEISNKVTPAGMVWIANIFKSIAQVPKWGHARPASATPKQR